MAFDSPQDPVPGEVSVIAVDGPSGSGKGTLASRLARTLGWHLLDSGALYRVIAARGQLRGMDLQDAQGLAVLAGELTIGFEDGQVWVDGENLTDHIRTETVSLGASQVAQLPPVRQAILAVQRSFRRPPGLVADGRDMGTVVFVDAPLKVFLDATTSERARRRYNQLKNKGLGVSLRDLLDSIKERDARDRGRAVSPLEPAEDAIVIDSTGLSIEEVLETVMDHARDRGLVHGAKH